MTRRLITTGLLLGGLALAAAACGTSDPQVQARQTGDTTATTAAPTTTSAPLSTTTAPATTAPPVTTAAPAAPPCMPEALTAGYTAKYGAPSGSLKVQKCAAGWATSSTTKGFDPPTFTLYRAEGDQWVAVNRSAGKLCEGQGVPPEIAPQIGCDT
jgi:hypothetical protein